MYARQCSDAREMHTEAPRPFRYSADDVSEPGRLLWDVSAVSCGSRFGSHDQDLRRREPSIGREVSVDGKLILVNREWRPHRQFWSVDVAIYGYNCFGPVKLCQKCISTELAFFVPSVFKPTGHWEESRRIQCARWVQPVIARRQLAPWECQ